MTNLMDAYKDLIPRERWKLLVSECDASGIVAKVWCRNHGVNAHSLYHWRLRLKAEAEAEAAANAAGSVAGMSSTPVCEASMAPISDSRRVPAEEDPAGVQTLPHSAVVVGVKETESDPPAFKRGPESCKSTAEVRAFVEMPQYSAAGPVQVESADVSEEKAEPVGRAKVVLQCSRWQVHIYDGFQEDTLSSVLRVLSHV